MKPEVMWMITGMGTIIMFFTCYLQLGSGERLERIMISTVITILYFLYVALICTVYSAVYYQYLP